MCGLLSQAAKSELASHVISKEKLFFSWRKPIATLGKPENEADSYAAWNYTKLITGLPAREDLAISVSKGCRAPHRACPGVLGPLSSLHLKASVSTKLHYPPRPEKEIPFQHARDGAKAQISPGRSSFSSYSLRGEYDQRPWGSRPVTRLHED